MRERRHLMTAHFSTSSTVTMYQARSAWPGRMQQSRKSHDRDKHQTQQFYEYHYISNPFLRALISMVTQLNAQFYLIMRNDWKQNEDYSVSI